MAPLNSCLSYFSPNSIFSCFNWLEFCCCTTCCALYFRVNNKFWHPLIVRRGAGLFVKWGRGRSHALATPPRNVHSRWNRSFLLKHRTSVKVLLLFFFFYPCAHKHTLLLFHCQIDVDLAAHPLIPHCLFRIRIFIWYQMWAADSFLLKINQMFWFPLRRDVLFDFLNKEKQKRIWLERNPCTHT